MKYVWNICFPLKDSEKEETAPFSSTQMYGLVSGFYVVFQMYFGWKFCWNLLTPVNDTTLNAVESMSKTAQNEQLDCMLGNFILSTLNCLMQGYYKNKLNRAF